MSRRLLIQSTAWGALTPLSVLGQDKTRLSLGTATPGGGFPVYGAAFAQTVDEADATLQIEPRNTKGSTENIPLIETGQLDMALVTGEPLHEAVNGIGRAPAQLKIIAAMYSSPGMFVARGDSAARSLTDLLGKPMAAWPPCGAVVPAGPASRRWPRVLAEPASSHPMSRRCSVSCKSTPFSSRWRCRQAAIRGKPKPLHRSAPGPS